MLLIWLIVWFICGAPGFAASFSSAWFTWLVVSIVLTLLGGVYVGSD